MRHFAGLFAGPVPLSAFAALIPTHFPTRFVNGHTGAVAELKCQESFDL